MLRTVRCCAMLYFISYILRFKHGNTDVKTSFENFISHSLSRTAFFTCGKVVSSNRKTPVKRIVRYFLSLLQNNWKIAAGGLRKITYCWATQENKSTRAKTNMRRQATKNISHSKGIIEETPRSLHHNKLNGPSPRFNLSFGRNNPKPSCLHGLTLVKTLGISKHSIIAMHSNETRNGSRLEIERRFCQFVKICLAREIEAGLTSSFTEDMFLVCKNSLRLLNSFIAIIN